MEQHPSKKGYVKSIVAQIERRNRPTGVRVRGLIEKFENDVKSDNGTSPLEGKKLRVFTYHRQTSGVLTNGLVKRYKNGALIVRRIEEQSSSGYVQHIVQEYEKLSGKGFEETKKKNF